MQAAAERERDQIAEVVAKEAAEHVEKARTRAAAETEELRRLAEEDVDLIKDWSKTEIERIRRDADRRMDERRKSLQDYLAKHETIIATEIDGVDAAIRGYRVALDRFFDELQGLDRPGRHRPPGRFAPRTAGSRRGPGERAGQRDRGARERPRRRRGPTEDR